MARTIHPATILMVVVPVAAAAQPDPQLAAIPNWVINETPTYEGSGQAMHPDVVYFPGGFNGYRFYMSMTPYPWNDQFVENPSILASNNGYVWTEPQRGINPLMPTPPVDHNADTDLLWNEATQEFYMHYMDIRRPHQVSMVQLLRSTDGIRWQQSTALTLLLPQDPEIVSPAVLLVNGTYYMFYNNISTAPFRFEYLTSPDGLTWDMSTATVVDVEWPAGVVPWHLDVFAGPDDRYYMLASRWLGGIDLYLAVSTDLQHWEMRPEPILTDGDYELGGQVYHLNLIHRSTGLIDASLDQLIVWFGYRRSGDIWGTAVAKFPLSELVEPRRMPVPEVYATIQSAIDASVYGDTVAVQGGVYDETIRFNGKDVVVCAADPDFPPTLTGDSQTDLVVFEYGESDAALFEGFRVDGGRLGVWCRGAAPSLHRNLFTNQAWRAVLLSGNQPSVLGPSSARIVNSTIDGASDAGVSMFSTAPAEVRNTIVVGCGVGIEVGPGAEQPVLDYNDVWGCDKLYENCPTVGGGTISLDPLLASDYQLLAGSPCRDAGDPGSQYQDPDGTRNDMGWRHYRTVTGAATYPIAPPNLALTFANPVEGESAWIEFGLERSRWIELSVFDVAGRRVRTLTNQRLRSGIHRLVWDGRDARGRSVSPGVYFYASTSGAPSARPLTGKVTVIR